MTEEAKTAIQTLQEGGVVSEQLPDFIKRGKAGQGTEALSSNALQPPRLKMAQALTPEITEGILPELKPGNFFSDTTGNIFGSSIKIIPCYFSESYLLYAPKVPGSPGGLLARANDAVHWEPANTEFDVVIDKKGTRVKWKTAETVIASGLDKWGTFDPSDQKSPPAAVHCLNLLAMLPEHLDEGFLVFSFMRSAVKAGKKFAGNLRISNVPSYGRVFELNSKITPNDHGGSHFEPLLKAAGFVADKNTFDRAEEVYKMAADRGIEVDVGDDVNARPDTSRNDEAAAAQSNY